MLDSLRSHLPSREQLLQNRWLGWLAPFLGHPRLWRWSRRGVALGVAIGVFFGLLIPIAQIPLATAASIILRANIPAAAASTLVTNPITFAPIYYAAYKLGVWVTGKPGLPPAERSKQGKQSIGTATTATAGMENTEELETLATQVALNALSDLEKLADPQYISQLSRLSDLPEPPGFEANPDPQIGLWQRISQLSWPLIVGLSITATIAGLACYALISIGWYWRVKYKRRRKRSNKTCPARSRRAQGKL